MPVRYVYGVIGLLTVAALYGCWCRVPLIWDGAYQFNATLIMQRPYFFLTRFHTFFLWYPTVWASRHTANMALLQSLFGLPFLLAPVAGLLLSWWMVRKDAPWLILWVAFGVCAATLPGQIFVINDSIFQQHLFWPIFVGMFVPLSMPKKIVIALLCVFQFPHQLGMLLFLGAAIATALVAKADAPNRRRLLVRSAILFGLFILALAKIVVTNHIPALYDSYAAQEANFRTAMDRWKWGVAGWPIAGLCFVYASAVFAYRQRRRICRGQGDKTVGLSVLSLLCMGIGALCWVYWAADGRLWWKALDYRRWVGPLSAPFFIMAAMEVFRCARRRETPETCRDDNAPPLREPLVLLLAATFALIIGIQSHIWKEETDQLMQSLAGYGGTVMPSVEIKEWADLTPLDHWGTADFVVARQGKTPMKLLLDPRAEQLIYAKPPTVPHADMYADPKDPTPGPAGYFDFHPLLKKLSHDRFHGPRGGPERLDIRSTPN